MKDPNVAVLLGRLGRLIEPAAGLDEVADWVATGRRRPRFYWRVWLERVWRWPLN